MDDTKVLELEGKQIVIHKAPATVAYSAALKYSEQIGKGELAGTEDCLYELLKYAEVELGDGRRAKLTNKEIINQHLHDVMSLMKLQKAVVEFNFGFFASGAPSVS